MLANFVLWELFEGEYYPAGKSLNQSCCFPYGLLCSNTGNMEELWRRMYNLPTDLIKYEKLSPQGICDQISVFQAKLFSRTTSKTEVNINFT